MIFPESMSPEWKITAYYLIVLIVVVVIAKSICALLDNGSQRSKIQFLLFAPVLSISSWQRTTSLNRADCRRLLITAATVVPLMMLVFRWFPVATSGLPWWLRSYLAILPFWLLIEAIQLTVQLCWLPGRRCLPPMNNRPFAARTVADFWGRRWNRLFGDWLRQVCFRPLARHPRLALGGTFVVSGLIHEALVSLPLWLVYKINCFGWMLLYFFIQLVAIMAERKWLRSSPALNRAFVWCAVLIPVPLILNQGTLLIFHLAILA